MVPILATLVLLGSLLGIPGIEVPEATAAEIQAVSGPTRLRVGDQNRSYLVDLACVSVAEADRQSAMEWIRRHGSRGTRVNLRPLGQEEGVLIAAVRVLSNGLDLGEGLVAQGLATPSPCPDAGGEG
ncbi:MAG: hypothetical protein RLZZ117_955 [Cyanobacteriota bacterium]|jgi:hypothetical protein